VQLTLVIPTYNEAENLPKLISALFALPLEDLQVLVVDDNSPDGTGALAEQLATEHPGRVQVRHRAGKLGLGSAYLEGFQQALEAGAEAVGQMDADFSHDPPALLDLVEALRTSDVALGSRYVPGGKPGRALAFLAQGAVGFR
jgi:dolichol-phosphate mannosyltransferase